MPLIQISYSDIASPSGIGVAPRRPGKICVCWRTALSSTAVKSVLGLDLQSRPEKWQLFSNQQFDLGLSVISQPNLNDQAFLPYSKGKED